MTNLVRSCRYLITGHLIYPGVRHRMFESIEKTGHNHALSETDRESYLQILLQASTTLTSGPTYPGFRDNPRLIKDKEKP